MNGTRLWFDVDGPGLVPDGPAMRERPTVILLHGGPGSFDHTYLKPEFARLAQVAQVVYLDMRDHGRSDHGDATTWSFDACADDIPPFCQALGIEKPIVYGHSLGGFVAIRYAERHPTHPAALILDSTCARFDAPALVENMRRLGGDEVAEIAKRVYISDKEVSREEWRRCWKLFGHWVPMEQEKARIILNIPLNVRGLTMMRDFDARADLKRIECPTLVLVGALDPGTTVANAREIMAGLKPGIGRLEIIEDAGHFAWKDQPERYWPHLERFVAGIVRMKEVPA
ncbi:MAG TPA: alpha/beta hydrolase [Candidatus Polarisedimenticolia bacterium]|nr:alpha/beta hydrolase [Candidatus Polarisedimenticolia bacterium]